LKAVAIAVLATCLSAAALPQGPWLGGQREIFLGPTDQGATVLGLYVNRKTGTSIGDIIDKRFVEVRLGWMGWKVSNGTFGGKPCKVLDTDGFTTVTKRIEGRKQTTTLTDQIKVVRQTYLDPASGKILRETYRWQDSQGAFTGEALYGKDEIELKVQGPGVNRTTTVFPEGGTDLLDAMYKPMQVNGKVLMQEKKFAVLNPLTGGVQKVTARISGHFNWNLALVKRKGTVVEITWPDHVQKAYVDENGELLKVDLPEGRYLLFESLKEPGK
jgi:hypothetical protein